MRRYSVEPSTSMGGPSYSISGLGRGGVSCSVISFTCLIFGGGLGISGFPMCSLTPTSPDEDQEKGWSGALAGKKHATWSSILSSSAACCTLSCKKEVSLPPHHCDKAKRAVLSALGKLPRLSKSHFSGGIRAPEPSSSSTLAGIAFRWIEPARVGGSKMRSFTQELGNQGVPGNRFSYPFTCRPSAHCEVRLTPSFSSNLEGKFANNFTCLKAAVHRIA